MHLFHLADERGWTVVAPHHEEAAGFMAEAVSRMTGKAAVCIGTLGPGLANLAGAIMCAKVENSPVIFLGGQRARITEQRVRRGRIQFVQQARLLEPSVKYCASIEYAEQTDEIIREGLRRALSGTPGPVYIEYPAHVIQAELDVPPPLPPSAYRLTGQTAGPDKIAAAVAASARPGSPSCWSGHAVHTTRAGESVKALADAMACPGHPDLGRHLVHRRPRGPHVPLRLLPVGGRRGGPVRPVPGHRHRARRAGPLRARTALGPGTRPAAPGS